MAKAKVPDELKFEKQDFDLFKAIDALDKKDFDWYQTLTSEQQKKVVPYMLLHWMSSVKKDGAVAEYYLLSTEKHANIHMFNENIQSNHPELQWLMLCAISPGIGKQFHAWLPHLNQSYGQLKNKITKKELTEYFTKIYSMDKTQLTEIAEQYTQDQHHRYRIGKMYPNLKLDEIGVLSSIITSADLDAYEEECGI